MTLDRKLSDLKGIGEKTEKLFQKIGVYTVGDILLNFPRTYIKYPDIKGPTDFVQGEMTAVFGQIRTPILNRKTRSMEISIGTLYVEDEPVEPAEELSEASKEKASASTGASEAGSPPPD